MITFAPNILAIDYLTLTKQLTPELKSKAIDFLEQGYQRMLKYRHDDGSFSAFGKTDLSGSTWLTAYVVKYFRRAERYIDVDESVIDKALSFVVSKQEVNGTFREDGVIFHKDLQGGTGSGIAFTSHVAEVVLENIETYPQYQTILDNAILYVENNYDPNDAYSLAIASYLLYEANNENEAVLFQHLSNQAIKTTQFVYWLVHQASQSISSLDIELNAYGLLILNQIPQLYPDGFKVLQWLISQQNSKGGFFSTQDTVIALEAICKFSAKFLSQASDLVVTITPDVGTNIEASVNSNTSLMNQNFQVSYFKLIEILVK